MSKTIKKMMALALAMVMMVAMALPAMAAAGEYEITVENTNTAMSIEGKEYYAYKVFDLTLGAATTEGDTTTYGAYAYSIKDDAWAFAKLTTGATTNEETGVITTTYGIVLTPSAADPHTYSVNGESMTDANARSLADALQSVLPATSAADGHAAGGSNQKAVISLSEGGWYAVYGVVIPTDPKVEPAEEVVAAVGLTTTDKKVTVNPKASVPTLDKKITGVVELEAGSETEVDGAVMADGLAAVAKVGAKVSYELDSVTPDLTGYSDYTFKIQDTITSGLTYDNTSLSSLVVKIGGNVLPAITTPAGEDPVTNYTLTVDGQTFTLTIPFNTLKKYNAGTAIVVTYDAVVNSGALTTDYENNKANLEYSHSPYDTTTNKTPDKETYVIDLNIDVLKIGNNDNAKKLDGAEFKLYRLVGEGGSEAVGAHWELATEPVDGAYYWINDDEHTLSPEGITPDDIPSDATEYNEQPVWLITPNVGGGSQMIEYIQGLIDNPAKTVYIWVEATEGSAGTTTKEYYKWDNNKVTWVATQAAGDTFTTNSEGKLTQQVRGLDKGTYYLEETKAPKGYNVLSAPVKVTISVSEADKKVTYSATTDGVDATVTNAQVDLTAAQNANQPVVTATINNNSGTELPSTGGIGTTIFYIVGVILVLGAGILLVTRRRMNTK